MAMSTKMGKIAYGMLFTLFIPGLGWLWAWRLDQTMPYLWPIPLPAWAGIALAAAGAVLMAASMIMLWVTGKGLPMNAYPPARFVSTGPYALFSHPIYLGFVVAMTGISIVANSPAGFWIVTTLSALAVLALVFGYENPRLGARFKEAHAHVPLFGLPPADSRAAPLYRRMAAVAITLGPWAIAYSILSRVPAPFDGINLRMGWERGIELHGSAIWPYSAAYLIAVMSPLLLRSNEGLRRFVISGWLVTLTGFAMMLCIHGHADLLAMQGSEVETALLRANRMFDASWLALPSFHVAWTVLAGYCLTEYRPKLRYPSAAIIGIVGVSCVLTGSHATVDVVAGLLLGMLSWHYRTVWLVLVGWAERLANSWSAIELGPIRIISHAIWSGLAAIAGMSIVVVFAGTHLLAEAAGVFVTGILGAGAWGYWLEGGGRLSRPFGYYGFLYSSSLALLVLAMVEPQSAGLLAAAFACGAPLAQAIGRLRCLVQGCCHGKPVIHSYGIRVANAQSRVAALSQLHGIAIHPTQLYSILSNVAIFACLASLRMAGTSTAFVAGLYLVLSSLARFVEEDYRGEPQTPRHFGLAIYQWLAIWTLLLGIVISMLNSGWVGGAVDPQEGYILLPLGAGVVAATLMSIDFPRSRRRFSRLTVGEPS
jgi:protein-S-isoprenylcysteine O-methyltransferase Ste14